MNELNDAFNLLSDLGVSDETISVVCAVNGYNMETAESVLYVTTGYRNFEQYLEEECPPF